MVTIDGYPIDVVVTEEHTLESDITDHPVEDGSDVSDNIRRKPRTLTLTNAVVSNTPIGAIATDDTRIMGATLPPVSVDAYRRLVKIWEDCEPVTIVTNLQKYESMGLESLSIPRDVKSAGGLIFTAHFKEVRIIKNKRVQLLLPNTGKEANLGLSIDRLVNGKNVLWRKGRPPGTSTATVPAGVIYGQEVVTIERNGEGKITKFKHKNGTELTTEELEAFTLDLDRDTRLMENRGLYRAEQQLDQTGKVIERAKNLADYKDTHPGENPDPSMFGLQKLPNGKWKAI